MQMSGLISSRVPCWPGGSWSLSAIHRVPPAAHAAGSWMHSPPARASTVHVAASHPDGMKVKIVRSVQPPSQPPPAGGRSRVPAPSGGGSGRGPSPCPRRRGAGVTPALPGRLHRAWCAMRMTVSRDHGRTRFPHPPARGRVWGRTPCLEAGRRGGGETPPLRRRPRLLPPGGSRGAPLLT